MRYQKAQDVLPAELLKEVQKYADGVYLYIPRRAGEKRGWGSASRYKEELKKRNESIRLLSREGETPQALAQRFHLSKKSIRRILQQAD